MRLYTTLRNTNEISIYNDNNRQNNLVNENKNISDQHFGK